MCVPEKHRHVVQLHSSHATLQKTPSLSELPLPWYSQMPIRNPKTAANCRTGPTGEQR